MSSIARRAVSIPAATLSDAAWTEVVSCVRDAYARFNVEIVDTRPTRSGYVMALFGGTGSELGLGPDSKGIAPIDTSSCETVDDAVVFVFTRNLGDDAARACEVAAHEIAHVFSVDHQHLAADLSSYLPFSGRRTFQDVESACGETSERPCACGRATQNSVRVLLDRLGPTASADSAPPAVSITASAGSRGSQAVRVRVTDATGVGSVTLHYADDHGAVSSVCGDGTLECTRFAGDYTFTIPRTTGRAVYSAEAVDLAGNLAVTRPTESTPSSSVIPVELVQRDGHGVVTARGDITAATVFWTDDRGVTFRQDLCEEEAGQWSVDVQLAPRAGQRDLVVQTTDASNQINLTRLSRTIEALPY
ncbi:MAG: hypothetical protein H0T42_01350 [Deltaproteobacteria bacterium]|nr:hypothetical protein [Deltaproteobacteria bacterium]